ncbi:uncharacterized protein LOC134717808 [Mytilus trossulus]|uniref:uncharacterized protein LOC134717808 n=1 Tax=Mytilus trossulus TaxID=6551 RepID=UPI003004B06D
MSIPIVVYLDDGWGTAENSEICENMALQVKSDLEKSGFVVNNKKSVWTPVQIMEWLGFNWNLKDGTLEIPVKKFENLKNIISALFECNIHITCRNLAKVCGKIISMLPALGSICQIMTRHLHMTICCRDYWDSFVYLNENVIQELRFWYFYCEKVSFRQISYFHRMPERIVFSDASEYAGAGYIVGSNNVAHFMWDKSEKTKSSSWRELKAVSNILQSVHNQLSGKLVKIYTDNQNVTKIIRKGSMKSELQDIALDVFNICLDNNIVLEIEWIPRDKNIQADELSKIFDFDDWGVSDIIFKYFDRLWGPFNCDLFADSRNKKVSRFFSKFFTPGTSGVDAFAYDWSAFNNWIVPPIYLITRVINYMLICKAKGALVIPKWKSAVYWMITQWKQFEELANDSRFAKIVSALPSIVEASSSKSTVKKYKFYFGKFRIWCSDCQLESSPANSTTVCLYIGSLIQQGVGVSVLESNFYSIKWYHDINFKYNPCSDKLLSNILEGGRRILSKPINKKEPITTDILKLIVSRYGSEHDLSNLRVCLLCLLGFSGFLRYSELAKIKRNNIVFYDSHVEITIDKSKTDIYRRGNTVIIARTGNETCPVKWLKIYLKLAGLESDSDYFIFRSLSFLKSQGVYKLSKNNTSLSYTRAREILLKALEDIGLDKSKFGLHSLRSGGATSAANNGVSDRLLKAHGRWSSDQSKDGYIKDNLHRQLVVSLNLGI